MALADLFDDPEMVALAKDKSQPHSKTKALSPDDIIKDEEAKLAAARNELDNAESALGKALREKLKGGADKVSEAYTALERATLNISLAEKAVEVARQIAKEAAISAEQENAIRDWSKAVKVADERLTALKSLSKSVSAFAQAWTEVVRLNEELFTACPAKLDMDAALMRINSIETLVRIEMARLGVPWAHDMSPSILHTQPAFDEVISSTPSVIRG